MGHFQDLFPSDCTTLPLFNGELLVSRSHALFCAIPATHVSLVHELLDGSDDVNLPDSLVNSLRGHGFGGPPRTAKPPSPSVQIQLTNACNLACSYCCTNSGVPRQQEIDRSTAFAIIDDVVSVHGPGTRVSLLGGEPLVVPWAIDLAECIVQHGLQLTIFTNGLLLHDEPLAKRLGALGKQGAQVRVSLAGATAESCDRVSHRPRFDAVIRGIHTLSRFGPPAHVDLMLLPDQVEEVAQQLTTLRALLPPQTPIALGIAYLSGREKGANLFASRAELERALDRISFEAGEVIPAARPQPLADRREGCSCALGHHLHVRSDGTLFTCFKMEERVGDLRSMSFSQGLRSLQKHARPVELLAYCKDCPLATLCGGGCRSENLQYTGDGDVPVCGPWRVRVLSELLAEDHVTALEWPATHLLAEAHARGIEGPAALYPVVPSRHLIDT